MEQDAQTTADEAPVLVEVRDGRMYLTLNRPKALNAHTDAMRELLIAAYERIDEDDDIQCGILLGAGSSFSAGADLKEAARKSEAGDSRDPHINYHFLRLEQIRKPMIACLHGWAVGGGLEMSLCCDVRFAAEDARLGTPEPRTNRGVPGIAVHRLARLMPMGEALKLMMSSQPMTARRAHEVGLVQELAPDLAGAVTAAERFADQMAECNPNSIRMIKKVAKWGYLVESDAAERFGAAQDRPHDVDRARGADFLASRSTDRT